MELINAEVRLYFPGREDWDTEFFHATCPTDIMTKATAIARVHHASHFTFGMATPEEEYHHRGPRLSRKATPSNVKDQVKAIAAAVGLDDAEE